MLIVHYKRMLI